MTISPETRRANLWLFAGLVLFAVGLCALILIWMRAHTKAEGGVVYPPTSFYEGGVERTQGHFHRISFFGVAARSSFCHFSIA